MSLKEFVKSLASTSTMHFYELMHHDGNFMEAHWSQPKHCRNKLFWLLGDAASLKEFKEQFNKPYTGYTHI